MKNYLVKVIFKNYLGLHESSELSDQSELQAWRSIRIANVCIFTRSKHFVKFIWSEPLHDIGTQDFMKLENYLVLANLKHVCNYALNGPHEK